MSFWGALFGEAKGRTWSPPPNPTKQYGNLNAAIAQRALDFVKDPYSTKEYGQFRTALGDAMAGSRSQVLDAVYKQFGESGQPGLRSGAAARAELGAETGIAKQAAAASVDWVTQARQQALDSFIKNSQNELEGYKTEVGGVQRWSDVSRGYLGDVFGAIGNIFGGGNQSAYSGLKSAFGS